MCSFRDVKNFDRFYLVVQNILCLAVCQLKLLKDEVVEAGKKQASRREAEKEQSERKASCSSDKDSKDEELAKVQDDKSTNDTENSPDGCIENEKSLNDNENKGGWSMQQKEKLMHLVSKVFLLNFPLYIACKNSSLTKLDELTTPEVSNLNACCDLHDTEIPVYLLRNVSLFCKLGGVCAMNAVFEDSLPSTLPLSMAHAMVAAIGNLKLWLNYRAVAQMFMPLRNTILRYMCNLEDKDLRLPAVKSMAGRTFDILYS